MSAISEGTLTMSSGERGARVLLDRLKTVVVKAPREAPNLFVLVCFMAIAVLVLYAYIVVEGL